MKTEKYLTWKVPSRKQKSKCYLVIKNNQRDNYLLKTTDE